MKFLILVIGVSTSILLFVIYVILLKLGYDQTLVQTFIFAAFGSYTLFIALSVRSLDKSIFSVRLFANKYLIGGIGFGIILMTLAVYVPSLQELFNTVSLPPLWALGVLGIGILNIVIAEICKWAFKKYSN